MSGLNSGQNPNLIRKAIDELVKEEFDRAAVPGECIATDTLFFKQENPTTGAILVEDIGNPGEFEQVLEEQTPPDAPIVSGNQKTFSILKYAKDLPVPREFYMDDQYGTVEYQTRMFGIKARNSRDKHTFRYTYADAFSQTTPDAAAIISNAHTALDGTTVDNLETAALSADSLKTCVTSLRLQKDQNGELGGYNSDGLLVPTILFPDARTLTDSQLIPGKMDNDRNWVSNIYPNLVVKCSSWLDATYNTYNSNADTSFFLVSRMHQITRFEREAYHSEWVDAAFDPMWRYKYRALFRQAAGAKAWGGIVGSSGTT